MTMSLKLKPGSMGTDPERKFPAAALIAIGIHQIDNLLYLSARQGIDRFFRPSGKQRPDIRGCDICSDALPSGLLLVSSRLTIFARRFMNQRPWQKGEMPSSILDN